MENKITTVDTSIANYYGVKSGEVDMFMTRARDLGAADYLMKASEVSTYDGTTTNKLDGNPTANSSIYGLQNLGTRSEYLAAYVGSATENNLTKASHPYKDSITSAGAIGMYKGYGVSGITGMGFLQKTNTGYNIQTEDTATENSTFRVTIINQ